MATPKKGGYRTPAGFLFTRARGLVIIALEVVLYHLVRRDSYPDFPFLQVLFAITISMIGLALVCRLPLRAIGALGRIIAAGHDALSPIAFKPGEWGYVIRGMLHDGGESGQPGPFTVSFSYAVLPYFGLILARLFRGAALRKSQEP